jgi:hypothetical protein
MAKYIVVDFVREASPLVDKSEKIGFNDSDKYPYLNMHPTNYGVYRTGEKSAIVAYIPTHLEDQEKQAEYLCKALNK